MKKYLSLLILTVIIVPTIALAQESENANIDGNQSKNNNVPIKLDNPLESKNIDSPQALIGQIINSLFGIIGSLALVMFVYGGLLWMTSSGSAEQVKKGKDIFMWAVIGLVVVFSAYSLVRFVITGVGG